MINPAKLQISQTRYSMTALQNISRDPQIGGRKIELRTEIIAPALEKRREGYGEPIRDYNQELRED